MIEMKVEGGDRIARFALRMQQVLSPEALTQRAILIAGEAGVALLEATVRACMEAVYDQPAGEYERTMELLDSHVLVERFGGLSQVVTIDPTRPVASEPHNEREMVYDYAQFVHNGYTQWVYGNNTGEFHPGKFWFHVAADESIGTILDFIAQAFHQAVGVLMAEAAA